MTPAVGKGAADSHGHTPGRQAPGMRLLLAEMVVKELLISLQMLQIRAAPSGHHPGAVSYHHARRHPSCRIQIHNGIKDIILNDYVRTATVHGGQMAQIWFHETARQERTAPMHGFVLSSSHKLYINDPRIVYTAYTCKKTEANHLGQSAC
jgi:hypothetical protein